MRPIRSVLRRGVVGVVAAGALLAPAVAGATDLPADAYIPPSGPITIDGDATDWGTPPTTFFANMYRAGKTDQPVESTLSLRYDCATQTLYALVRAEPGVTIIPSNADNFIKLGNNTKLVDGSNSGSPVPPQFAYIGTTGWEAAVTLAPGTYSNLNVHAQVEDGGSQTSAVANRAIPITIKCGAFLTVSKTATPTFTRTYGWTLQKVADQTQITTTADSATVGYTVTATKTGPVDSAWKVQGAITAVNSTDFAADNVVVTEQGVDNGDAPCVITGATVDGVAATDADAEPTTFTLSGPLGTGQTLVAAYECTYNSAPTTPDGINRATVSWREFFGEFAALGQTAPRVAGAQAGFVFDDGASGNPTVVNGSLTVEDTYPEFGGPKTVSETTTWNYQKTFSPLATGCEDKVNTVSSVGGIAPPASATVRICKEVPPPPAPPAPPVTPPSGTPAGTPSTPVGPSGTPTRPVLRRAALSIVKQAPARASAGQVVPYTITVRNRGNGVARGVVISDTLPAGTSLARRVAGARLVGGALTWRVGNLAPRGSRTVRLQLRLDAQASGERCNTATASAGNARRVSDTACTQVTPIANRVQPAVTG